MVADSQHVPNMREKKAIHSSSATLLRLTLAFNPEKVEDAGGGGGSGGGEGREE